MTFDINLRDGGAGTFDISLSPPGIIGYIKVWNGSSWVPKPIKVWNGASWQIFPLKYWNGSSWITTSY